MFVVFSRCRALLQILSMVCSVSIKCLLKNRSNAEYCKITSWICVFITRALTVPGSFEIAYPKKLGLYLNVCRLQLRVFIHAWTDGVSFLPPIANAAPLHKYEVTLYWIFTCIGHHIESITWSTSSDSFG